jgi:hypothetical protein
MPAMGPGTRSHGTGPSLDAEFTRGIAPMMYFGRGRLRRMRSGNASWLPRPARPASVKQIKRLHSLVTATRIVCMLP